MDGKAEIMSAYDLLPERERELLRSWPRFEDGEPVAIGDAVEGNRGGAFEVKRITLERGGWTLRDKAQGSYLDLKPGQRAKRADSWELLEADAEKKPCGYLGYPGRCDASCPYFDGARDCSAAMALDIVRRAKALAGVE